MVLATTAEEFGNPEWANQTTVHPIGLSAFAILAVALLTVPRRFAAAPLLVLVCFIPTAQRIVVLGLDFDLLRLMVVTGALRCAVREELRGLRWQSTDTAVLCWIVFGFVSYGLRIHTSSALVGRAGWAFDIAGLYLLGRVFLREWSDVHALARCSMLLSVPVALAFLVEHATQRNVFSIFGGVPEFTAVREGRLRCQGAFSHPILAGCFWAVLLPLAVAQWWTGTAWRLVTLAGVAFFLLIIVFCASSTPVAGAAAIVVGWCFYPLRRRMRLVFWGGVGTLVALHLVMKKPVWHLICRVDFAGGSTGYHRYEIIDQTIRRFGEWWLVGTSSAGQWFDVGYFDATNQFVLEALNGGLATLLAFVAVLTCAFLSIGRILRRADFQGPEALWAWSLGVALFVHCVNFMGVSYFGQIILLLHLTLASSASLAQSEAAVEVERLTAAGEPRVPHGAALGLTRLVPECPPIGSSAGGAGGDPVIRRMFE